MAATGRIARIHRTGLGLGIAVAVLATACLPAPGTIERATVSSDQTQAAAGGTTPEISGDGRFVAFTTRSNDLVPEDRARSTGRWDDDDVLVRDLWTGRTELVSTTPAGQRADHRSWGGHLSTDGRYVAFSSVAGDLTAAPDADGDWDVFLRDRKRKTTTLLSPAHGPTASGAVRAMGMSDDARFVLMQSGDGYVLLDRQTSTFQRLPDEASDRRPVLSGDGSTVAYLALVSDPKDGSRWQRQHVWDRATETAEPIGPPELATPYPDSGVNQSEPVISDDGDVVLWTRTTSDAVPGDTGVDEDVLRWERATGEVTVVTPALDTGGPVDWMCACAVDLSGDGRWAAAQAMYAPKVPGGRPIPQAVVVWRLDGAEVHHVGRNDDHVGDVVWSSVRLSDDGRIATFASGTSTLVPDDTNGQVDVFAWARPS